MVIERLDRWLCAARSTAPAAAPAEIAPMLVHSSIRFPRSHRHVVACVGLGLGLLITGAASAAVRTWDGGAGTLNWNDATNWSPDGVPTASDDVVIDVAGSTVLITIAGANGTINSLASNENVQVSSTLTIAGTSTINGLVSVSGVLSHASAITFAGGLTMNAGTLSGAGAATVPSGATLTLATSTNVIAAKTLSLGGTAQWTAGQVSLQNATLAILPSGVFNASANTSISQSGSSSISNAGTFNRSGTSSSITATFNNTGTLNVDAGTMGLSLGTNSGTIAVDSGATLNFANNHTHAAGSLLGGAGTITFSGGTHLFPAGAFQPTGTFSVQGGSAVTLTDSFPTAALTSPLSGALVCNADQTMPDLTVSGTLSGSGNLSFPSGLSLSGGTLAGSGVVTIPAGATLTLGTSTNTLNGKTIQLGGTANWTLGQLNFQGTTLNILPSGIFNASSPASIAAATGTNVINNAGTLNKLSAASSINVPLNNSGLVNLDAGTLTVNGGTNVGTYDIDAGATLTFNANHTHDPASLVTGAGTVNFNGGTHLFPAGTMLVSGSIVIGTSAQVTLNNAVTVAAIASPIAGTLVCNVDQVFPAVTVSGSLGGPGNLSFPNGLTMAGATLFGPGVLSIPSGATCTIGASTNTFNGKTINLAGTADWTLGQLNFQSTTLNILPTGVFNLSSPASIVQSFGINAINNGGVVNKISAASTISIPLNNSGVVNVDAGSLTVSGGTNLGTYAVDTGATLRFNVSQNHDPASLVTGAGSIVFDGGTHLFPAGTFAPLGTFTVATGSNVTLNNSVPTNALTSPLSGTLVLNVDQTVGALTVTGILSTAGSITFTSGLTLAGGQLSGSGVATIPSGATLGLGTSTNTLAKTINVSGTVDWSAGQVNFQNTTLNLLPGSVFNATASAALAQSVGTNALNMQGVLNKSGGAASVSIPFNNTGIVNVDGGTLTLNAGSNAGTYAVDAGASLVFGNSHTHAANSLLTGAGSIAFNGGNHTFPSGTFAPSGTFVVNSGSTVTMSAAFPSATLASPVAGTLVVNANQTFPATTVTGTLGGSGAFDFPQGLTLSSCTLAGSGGTTIPSGAALAMNASTTTLARSITLGGTAQWTSGQLNFQNATFTILAGGVFNASASAAMAQSSGTNAFTNAGTFNKTAGASTIGFPFTNSGTFSLTGGSFTTATAFTQTGGATILNGGTFTKNGAPLALQGGSFGGTGTFNGAIAQTGGSIAPGLSPGSLAIATTLTQNASSTLDIELGGTSAGSGHDQLTVTGSASLAGTLRLTFVNGFLPHFGDSFEVLTAGSLSGTFSSIDVIGYPDCVAIASYSATAVTVTIESVPPIASCKNIEVNLSASGAATIAAADVDNGSSDNCEIASLEVTPNAFTCANLGPNIVTLTVRDHAQNLSTCQAIVTVHDVTAPVIIAFPEDQAFGCASQIPAPNTALVTATDACGPITITHVGDSTNGGAGCAASPLVVHRTYRATDGSGNATERVQHFTVVDVTAPVIVAFPANQSLACPGAIPPANVGSVIATDGCGGAVIIAHLGDINNGGAGCPDSPLVVTRTYRASDPCGNAVTQAQTFTIVDVTAPSITAFPADAALECEADLPAANVALVTALDECDPNVLVTHEGDVGNGGTGCSDAPLVITRTYRATDACGHFVEQAQIFTIVDTTPPVVTQAPPNASAVAECGAAILPDLRGTLTATDGCVTPTIEQSPAPGAALAVGSHPITFTLRDACQNTTVTSCTFVVAADSCPADLDGSGVVGAPDLAILLGSWGECTGCCADLDGVSGVGAPDLALLLGAWGPCPIGDTDDAEPATPAKKTPAATPDDHLPPAVADGSTATPPATPSIATGPAPTVTPTSPEVAAPTEGERTPRVIEVTSTQGILVIDGDLLLEPDDRVTLRVGGATLLDCELIVVTGTAQLDGVLVLEFEPALIDAMRRDGVFSHPLPVLAAERCTGRFATVLLEAEGLPLMSAQCVGESLLTLVVSDREVVQCPPEVDPAQPAVGEAAGTLCGDLDGDGRCSVIDLLAFLRALLDPAGRAAPDLNGDRLVDAEDLSVLLGQLGRMRFAPNHASAVDRGSTNR